ncbi:hypothetical protein MHL31_11390 [Lutibacter sp. A80]|uniref:hypothetical protein n=1 Tax=Lutibacter sp. A80 TaxID=2918453 RepID=UPI001F0628DB|nr:hypothetical protein [Lutibacter sp. A80]UMB59679.1 hypothetical protein MHL31_11390 [Lutibacter sp. A80]
MKNLKKLSVVLFATLLSFNFTSCIDDGVSDAVDQVYLAQAEFLKAQAALKEADAQKVVAEAAYQDALAAVETARAAGIDAMTENQLLQNEAQVEANALQAQKNVIFLAEEEAKLEVALQTQMNLLQAAQSEYEVAMVNLGEAVAAAKDALILGYYGDYATVTAELQELYEDKIEAEHDLAVKELMLVAINNPVDMVSRAYYQAMLEAELAELEGKLVAEEANLAALEAITEADAGAPAQAITDLEAQIAVLKEQYDAVVIEHAEAINAKDQAREAWEASTAEYNEVIDAEDLLKAAIAAKKAHTDQMAADTASIATYQNIIDVKIPNAEQAVTDAVTAYTGTITDLEAAQDALGTQEDTFGDPFVWPAYDDDKIDPAVTLYDEWFNAAIDEEIADYALSQANYYYTPQYPGVPYVVDLEYAYTSAENALATYVPGTPIADLEAALADALAEEVAAQAAWIADPDGFTIDAGDDGVAGENQTTTGETWVQVVSYGLSGPTFGTVTYDAFASVQLGEDVVDDPLTPADETVTSVAVSGVTTAPFPAVTVIDGTMVGEWFNVEADDSSTPNFWRLLNAREAAYNAQANLDMEVDGVSDVTEDRDEALEEVVKAYAALGYEFPTDGTLDASDILAVEAYIVELGDAATAANEAENEAQNAVNEAMTAIGTTFNKFDSPADWIALGSNASVDSNDLNDSDPNTLFEEVENALINWSIAKQKLDALGTVAYNQGKIDDLETELEELDALLPAHDLAIADLQARYDALLAEFGFDTTAWDFEGDMGYEEAGILYNLPLYAEYLDAVEAYSAVNAKFVSLAIQIEDLENLIDAYAFVQSGDFVTDGTNVADFMEDVAEDIEQSKEDIAELEEDIEIQKGLVATGIVDKDTAEAWVAEYERRLSLLETEIEGYETAAASLLARINALLN